MNPVRLPEKKLSTGRGRILFRCLRRINPGILITTSSSVEFTSDKDVGFAELHQLEHAQQNIKVNLSLENVTNVSVQLNLADHRNVKFLHVQNWL